MFSFQLFERRTARSFLNDQPLQSLSLPPSNSMMRQDEECQPCGTSVSGSSFERNADNPGISISSTEASPWGKFSSPILTQEWHDPTSEKLITMGHVHALASASSKYGEGFNRISPGVFYGSPLGIPARNPRHLLQLLNENDGDLAAENELITRKKIWCTFPRQDEAFRFAENLEGVSIFSYEDHFNGQRRFLVSTYDEFWRRYSRMEENIHHHYEVVQEGIPCHLYFDLEFNRRANRGHNGAEMVDVLISYIFEALFDTYGISGEHNWVVKLDSSTEEKFSSHLIIRIPNVAFKDNSHVGAFVAEVHSRISNSCQKHPRLRQLYILKDTNTTQSSADLFVDRSVYSRNRCFRLPFSSKAGKRSMLLPTDRFKCKGLSKRQVFMESLVCRVDQECKELLIFHSEAKNNRQLVPYISRELVDHSCMSDMPNRYLSGKSPFPLLDNFMLSLVSSGSVHGWIRSWYWFSDFDLIVYNIGGNRFCERIGRPHKSNHVMYVVDFKRCCYYQKCYDPECQGYRSSIRPMPPEVVPTNLEATNMVEGDAAKETVDVGFSLRIDDTETYDRCSSILKTDSIKRDTGWWQEVVQKVDHIESSRKVLDFGDSDFEGYFESV